MIKNAAGRLTEARVYVS